MLIVSMFCLGLVVAPVCLLALTQAGWVLALLSVVVAIAVPAAELDAAFADGE